MNQLVELASNKELTMSSLEIAELVGKRHDNVRESIERCAERGAISLPALHIVKIQRERREEKVKVYVFSGKQGKRDSIVVMAQLSPVFTGKIVDRWQELEEQNIVAYAAGILLNMASKIPLGESKDLYIIHFTDGTCKVGRSKNVPERVNTVRTSSGRSIVKYFHLKDKGNFEQPILKALEPVRLEGEFVQEGYLDYVLDLVKGLTQVTELTPVHFN